jgi:hypothetical protein
MDDSRAQMEISLLHYDTGYLKELTDADYICSSYPYGITLINKTGIHPEIKQGKCV